MSKVWITSDLHIGHNREFVYEYRGFASCEEHDAALYLDYPEVGGYHFYLSHYPTLVAHEKLKPVKTALINLYGYCVCLDAHDMKPVLMEDIIGEIKKKRSAYRDDL